MIFDAVGTLLFADPPVDQAYAQVAARCGVLLAPQEIRQRFRRAFERQDALDRADELSRTSPERERERWEAIVAEVIPEVPTHEAFPLLWDHFARAEHWRVYDDVSPVWAVLAARGVTLGIASNFDERLVSICTGLEPLLRCEHLFISSLVGYRKPGPGFFRAVEARLGLSGSDILLVGDDRTNDYAGARSAGWQAIHLDRYGNSPQSIPSLRALVDRQR